MTTDAIMRSTATVWADGYGRWHVLVPMGAASPVLAARRALREEIKARDARTHQAAWMGCVRVPQYDAPGRLAYAER